MLQFFAPLLGGLLTIMDSLMGRVLIALGLSFVSYTGIEASLTWLKGEVISHFQSLPPQALQVVSAIGVGNAISIIFSSYATALAFKGWSSGGKKLVDAAVLRGTILK